MLEGSPENRDENLQNNEPNSLEQEPILTARKRIERDKKEAEAIVHEQFTNAIEGIKMENIKSFIVDGHKHEINTAEEHWVGCIQAICKEAENMTNDAVEAGDYRKEQAQRKLLSVLRSMSESSERIAELAMYNHALFQAFVSVFPWIKHGLDSATQQFNDTHNE
jgi:hypothetical protein